MRRAITFITALLAVTLLTAAPANAVLPGGGTTRTTPVLKAPYTAPTNTTVTMTLTYTAGATKTNLYYWDTYGNRQLFDSKNVTKTQYKTSFGISANRPTWGRFTTFMAKVFYPDGTVLDSNKISICFYDNSFPC